MPLLVLVVLEGQGGAMCGLCLQFWPCNGSRCLAGRELGGDAVGSSHFTRNGCQDIQLRPTLLLSMLLQQEYCMNES